MPSSLATQLIQNASLNAALLSTTRRKPESYIFPSSQASTHDIESIHFIASNAFLQLTSVQPSCRKYEGALFSDAVKDVDRTLLSKDKDEELDEQLRGFMRLLGPWLMEGMVGKILEWLVRRFRINEFNGEDVLALFLPYHDSPHFAKMLSILHIKPQSRFSFLLPFKAAAKPLPRTSLVSSMIQDTDVARFVSSLLPSAYQGGYSHRTLLAFNIGVMHEYIIRCKILDEGIIAFVVSALVETLNGGSDGNVVLGSYVLLSTLSHKCRLTPHATKAIIGSMVESSPRVSTAQFMKAAVAFCAAQDQVDEFEAGVAGKVLKLSNIGEEICSAFAWASSEKFISPLLSGFASRLPEDTAHATVQLMLTSSTIPSDVTRRLAMVLIHAVVFSSEDLTIDTAPQRAMLSTIQQRHTSILQTAADDIVAKREDAKEAVEQLIISLSMIYSKEPKNKENADMVVASTNANLAVRVVAVESLLKKLSNEDIEGSDLTSIHSALLARTHDTKAPVIQALYSQPSLILPILTISPESYLSTITQTLSNQPSRALIRAHLSFLASHFCTANPTLAPNMFDQCFFRFLLFSKSRKETAKATWEIIEEGKDGIGAYEVVQGCVDDWRWHTDRPGAEMVDVMAKANMAIAARMAENILASSDYSLHSTSLIAKMKDADPHTRTMALLVARALLSRLSGKRQIDAAGDMLKAIHLETLEDMEDISDGDNGEIPMDDQGLGLKIVQKPAGRKTTYWLRTSIFSLFPLIPRPTGVVLDWFADPSSDATDTRGFRYLSLIRAVYKLANSSASLPLLTTNIIRSLFLNLNEDVLVFLLGIVTRSLDAKEDKAMCVAALRHAASFLAAQPNIDFQTILPSLFVAIWGEDIDIRYAATDCIAVVASNHEDLHAVYGFDTIYGDKSGNLKYLDAADVLNYVKNIINSKDLFAQDANYFRIFHHQHLARKTSDSKVDAKYKQRILSYLLSHIVAIGLPSAKIALLKVIGDISDEVKARALLPVMQDLVQPLLVDQFGTWSEEYVTLIVSSFDKSSSGALNETNSGSWPIFASFLRYFFQAARSHAPRVALGNNLEQGLFEALSSDRQVETCIILLQIGVHDPNAVFCKKVLGNIVRGPSLIQHLLVRLQPTSNQIISPAKKRTKLDEPASSPSTADLFPSLALLAEILATSPLPGSVDLISQLLETLNSVLHYESPTQGDKSFVEQLLMTAVEHAAEKVIEIPNLSPSSIRLDILVELIRVSENTQTFHQALLLMATLARLTPESVLHNVMPVFTFMGSNVFHRDDSYSFRVVQQTIDSIVPVMVSSLKTKFSGEMDLYIGSRDFLRIFTDAANHIPRHRRTHFFSHLVDILGPESFLAPVCMLLIDKVANRVIRQSADEVQGFVALPISVLQHYTNQVQISTLTELLRESRRLADRVTDPMVVAPTFLDLPRDDEHSLPMPSVLKRRAQALIIFVGHALQASANKHPYDTVANEAVSDFVYLLVHMATLSEGAKPESTVDYISKAAQSTLAQSLGAMPAANFISAVSTTIGTKVERIQGGALVILSNRLHNVTDPVRRTATPIINDIVDVIKRIMSSTSNEPLMDSAMKALRTIALTMSPGEESSLASAITSVLAAIRHRNATATAMMTLRSLVTALGPRIIPNFRDIINNCVSVLNDALKSNTESLIVENASSVLHGILISIPTFWGSEELTRTISLHTDYHSSAKAQPTALTALMKAIAKRAPAKILLPTLCDMWSSIEASPRPKCDRVIAYFDVLKKSLRAASRSVVLENTRPLFKVFMEAFDIPSNLSEGDNDQVEAHSISAFMELVVKLNDAAFRPLFRKLFDWAFTNDNDTRKITFCHIYSSLLDFFQGLMTTYMLFLLRPFTELLRTFAISAVEDKKLWLCIIETLTKSFNFDEGAFWRSDKLRQIALLLVEQVPVCIQLGITEGKTQLSSCLEALMESVNDDGLLKSINLDLLMHTRSEDVRLRTFALTCSETLWRKHGGKLLGFVAETTTFIAECVEDESDLVVHESHRLKKAVESVGGEINGL